MENMYLEIIRVILALAAIIAAILVFSRYGNRLKLNLNLKQRETPYGLRKADSIHLGYKKFVSVVEVQDRVLVIGTSEREVTLLAQWTKEGKGI